MEKKEKDLNGCLISYEILLLIKWIQEHDPSLIDLMVARAARKGFIKFLKKHNKKQLSPEESHTLLLTMFMNYEEAILLNLEKDIEKEALGMINSFYKDNDAVVMSYDALHEKSNDAKQKGLLRESLDKNSFHLSLEEAFMSKKKSSVNDNTRNKNKILYEALKNWRPAKNSIIN